MYTAPVFVCMVHVLMVTFSSFLVCIVKKKQQKMSGVRKAGKIMKCGTGQGKELPLVVRAKGLWVRLRRYVSVCLSVCMCVHLSLCLV